MRSVDYLTLAKRRLCIESDYALAAALSITRASVSQLMRQRTTMSDETAVKVARILDLPEGLVLVHAHGERERNPDVKAAWTQLAQQLAGTAAAKEL
ncbi:hypothetical protein E4K72_05950 [Oxalobacteraceae bacterium OM1]|nr:hypothetical protein E4K72_05950 [Oxalobacteraceae bacterium OM1]